ncbi:maleylpyruvate isomerase family mycothiol-dependent enzyme [Streptomyces sp. AC536]|uniref:maleylpyruvate isomerase family mycothiol-dependent enzyme n=1 Tax=Streptomyces buecherae TaxID=2763006 RepID=UPI00164E37C4|nr:maleylpyruvate isomerase family mycothiol-dependent enzyme [Streptomyces buecherae]MBC3986371.1 maleylpyruvate isomerase family mycothiol-dependent enzyme [Streptomyces buecherae]QNJ42684.1 maleylpyruvate isomerase family mycothiol-dependent enzyme [Streptomyces buecherae]
MTAASPKQRCFTDEEYLRLIEAWTAELFDISAHHLDVTVPSCPGWRLRDLVHHVGNIAYFVNAVIDAAGPEPEFTDATPRPDAEVTGWAADQTHAMVKQLRALDPATHVWNWSREPQRLDFWPRCIAHEALVHAWDAHHALGRERALPTRACLDGIGEILDIQLPLRTEEVADARWTAVVRATDEEAQGARWSVTIDHGAVATMLTTGHQAADDHADVLLSGPADRLYLGLWRRVPLPLTHGAPDRVRVLCTD